MDYYVSRGRQMFGPYASSQLREMAAQGIIQRSDLIAPVGSSQWAQAATFENLFSPPPKAVPIAPGTGHRPMPIELTSKRYKLVMLVGILLIIYGIFGEEGNGTFIGVGALAFILGKAAAWWNHG